jgi:hypothetical protein
MDFSSILAISRFSIILALVGVVILVVALVLKKRSS